jgi:glucose-6-phosphate dehydrogenase assembly protein OpcA
MPAVSDSVWSAHDTSPMEIEGALRNLLNARHAQDARYVAARVLNLVCIVDREWSGEIANRLRGVGRYHASRTVVCAVEAGRHALDAVATVAADSDPVDGAIALVRETVVVTVGHEHLDHLDSIVDPLVVTDLATVVWSPHRHDEALESLMRLAQVVLLDSVDEPDVPAALRRAAALSEQAYVVDLAWLRSTPWRERVAATFDPASLRGQLSHISALEIRHGPTSRASALLLGGWMSSRLGWDATKLMARGDGLTGKLRRPRGEVKISLQPVAQDVRGLAGLTVETSDGASIALDRGAGGLRAVRRTPKGVEHTWTVLGASRGEPGILGEGIRQALLRDPTYRPALQAAEVMVGGED